jgi:hypothetical protein
MQQNQPKADMRSEGNERRHEAPRRVYSVCVATRRDTTARYRRISCRYLKPRYRRHAKLYQTDAECDFLTDQGTADPLEQQ